MIPRSGPASKTIPFSKLRRVLLIELRGGNLVDTENDVPECVVLKALAFNSGKDHVSMLDRFDAVNCMQPDLRLLRKDFVPNNVVVMNGRSHTRVLRQ